MPQSALAKNIREVLNEERITLLMDKYASAITCFCFMGGDANPNRVAGLAGFMRLQYPEIKTAWYSGCEGVPEGFDNKSFWYIKLGGSVEELGNLKRETGNQHLFEIQQDGGVRDVSYLFKKIKK